MARINEELIRKVLTDESDARLAVHEAFTNSVVTAIDGGEVTLWRARLIAEQETMHLKRTYAAASVERNILAYRLRLAD